MEAIEVIEYDIPNHINTVALIGKKSWLYPKKIKDGCPITLIECLDQFKWRDLIQDAIDIKHLTHMDYLKIETKEKLIYIKSTSWGYPQIYKLTQQ